MKCPILYMFFTSQMKYYMDAVKGPYTRYFIQTHTKRFEIRAYLCSLDGID